MSLKYSILLVLFAFAACNHSEADLGDSPSKLSQKNGKPYATKFWKSPKLQVCSYHLKGDIVNGITSVMGFINTRVVEVDYLTDDLLSHFPADKAWAAALLVFSGSGRWIAQSEGSSNEGWKEDGHTAFLLHDQRVVVLADDQWLASLSQDKLLEFISEVTAWGNS